MYFYSIIILVAGVCVPVLAILNSGLGRELSSPAAACMVLCVIAFFTSSLVLIFTGPAAIFKTFDCSRHF
ncbi:MAG: hypothetical protein CFH10_00419 [Alphaproteobacteria bacterium MarineAlpha4_Bin2]|nr:MAG: hypothetical protein CFH10_00419 [Alphaproteobacteria bacterium MarineAlpha4_Bin2]